MTTKRATPQGSRGAKARAATGAAKKAAALDPVEEKLIRMRKGLTAPDDLPLPQQGQSHPNTRAKLLEIEARAFERSGRLDQLRREVGLEASATDQATKAKIISRLAGEKPAAKAKPEKAAVKSTSKAATKTKRR